MSLSKHQKYQILQVLSTYCSYIRYCSRRGHRGSISLGSYTQEEDTEDTEEDTEVPYLLGVILKKRTQRTQKRTQRFHISWELYSTDSYHRDGTVFEISRLRMNSEKMIN